jgi:hypothetical protein
MIEADLARGALVQISVEDARAGGYVIAMSAARYICLLDRYYRKIPASQDREVDPRLDFRRLLGIKGQDT